MRFRPGDLPQGDPSEDNTPVEWEDNWLSNLLAYISHKLLPGWCQTEDHWTSATTRFLFTDCPCCLLFRGLSLGLLAGMIIGIMVTTLTTMIIWHFSGAAG